MKKSLVFVGAFALMLSLTGCGSNANKDTNTLTCTSGDETGKVTYVFDFDDNNTLKSVKTKMEFESEESANMTYGFMGMASEGYSDVKLDGKVLTYTQSADSFKEQASLEKATKDIIKTNASNSGMTCK